MNDGDGIILFGRRERLRTFFSSSLPSPPLPRPICISVPSLIFVNCSPKLIQLAFAFPHSNCFPHAVLAPFSILPSHQPNFRAMISAAHAFFMMWPTTSKTTSRENKTIKNNRTKSMSLLLCDICQKKYNKKFIECNDECGLRRLLPSSVLPHPTIFGKANFHNLFNSLFLYKIIQ